jgi:hypothetical protein
LPAKLRVQLASQSSKKLEQALEQPGPSSLRQVEMNEMSCAWNFNGACLTRMDEVPTEQFKILRPRPEVGLRPDYKRRAGD